MAIETGGYYFAYVHLLFVTHLYTLRYSFVYLLNYSLFLSTCFYIHSQALCYFVKHDALALSHPTDWSSRSNWSTSIPIRSQAHHIITQHSSCSPSTLPAYITQPHHNHPNTHHSTHHNLPPKYFSLLHKASQSLHSSTQSPRYHIHAYHHIHRLYPIHHALRHM